MPDIALSSQLLARRNTNAEHAKHNEMKVRDPSELMQVEAKRILDHFYRVWQNAHNLSGRVELCNQGRLKKIHPNPRRVKGNTLVSSLLVLNTVFLRGFKKKSKWKT